MHKLIAVALVLFCVTDARYGTGNTVHILVNFADKEETVDLPKAMRDEMHDGAMVKTVTLPVSGVAVLSEDR